MGPIEIFVKLAYLEGVSEIQGQSLVGMCSPHQTRTKYPTNMCMEMLRYRGTDQKWVNRCILVEVQVIVQLGLFVCVLGIYIDFLFNDLSRNARRRIWP